MTKKIWSQEIDLNVLNQVIQNTMVEWLGIEFTEIGDDFLMAKMPVDHRTVQPYGIMHGGASCVLAETVGSVAANYVVDRNLQHCVGLDINTNHLRAIREGFVFGKATPIHLGHTTQVWNIEIRDKLQRFISISRLTMAVLNK